MVFYDIEMCCEVVQYDNIWYIYWPLQEFGLNIIQAII